MKNPQFSIIVPAHNSAAFLGRALGSIRRQTVSNYELIVVADACTDNTAEVAEWYTDTIMEPVLLLSQYRSADEYRRVVESVPA